ncbi:MAG: ATP-binding cassette domain-containing protein [Acidimicrobiia bacterium]
MAFGGVLALRGVDLDVTQGERLGILGPNGAGKTTLFNIVAGDFAPTAGTVFIGGEDVSTAPARIRPGLGVARTYQKTRPDWGLPGHTRRHASSQGSQLQTICLWQLWERKVGTRGRITRGSTPHIERKQLPLQSRCG